MVSLGDSILVLILPHLQLSHTLKAKGYSYRKLVKKNCQNGKIT